MAINGAAKAEGTGQGRLKPPPPLQTDRPQWVASGAHVDDLAVLLEDEDTILRLNGSDGSSFTLIPTVTTLPTKGHLFRVQHDLGDRRLAHATGTPVTAVPTELGTGESILYVPLLHGHGGTMGGIQYDTFG